MVEIKLEDSLASGGDTKTDQNAAAPSTSEPSKPAGSKSGWNQWVSCLNTKNEPDVKVCVDHFTKQGVVETDYF